MLWMAEYETLKGHLAQNCHDAAQLLEAAGQIAELSDDGLSGWKTTCASIAAQLSEEIMRVAVVGAIKSGKSTFVNTLFGADHLKRGAGVVTSIVTRVRTGQELKAVLFLKSWAEVNREIHQAAVLLPDHQRSDRQQAFDIRRETDRQALERALNDLAADQLISKDTRSAGSVLLAAYLAGYERVRQLVQDERATVVFENDRFARHRDFVGDDALAVYLKDVLLEIDGPGLGQDVEIADCQGSDSPNPLHLAMIQDYLMMAHLTLYVISSRTGLRQADIRFLSMIREMGILDTVGFVVNCDFSEHEDLEDLVGGTQRIEQDLRLICPEPAMFTFSALFQLMAQSTADLSEKERARYAHWCRETEMVAFSAAQRVRFKAFLHRKVDRERSALLLKNHLERLEIVSAGIARWIGFNRDLLTRDASGAKTLVDQAHRQHEQLARMQRTLKNTLDGAVSQVKRDLKAAVDRFFDSHADGVVDGTLRFIRGHPVELHRYDAQLHNAGFAKTLYTVFQEFKQAVDGHMAETVNPQVIRFVRTQEEHLMAYLDEIAGPYGNMIDEALAHTTRAMEADADVRQPPSPRLRVGPELENIRKSNDLALPAAAATMHYSVQIRTEAVMRFGFYKIVNLFKKAFKQSDQRERQEQFLALASAVKRMKRETERSILFHLKDYKENIKFQYVLKLADAAGQALYRQMLERFQHQGADLSRLTAMVAEQRLDKQALLASLDRLAERSAALEGRMDQFKSELSQLTEPPHRPSTDVDR
jgi:hypothetical protein